MKKLFLILALLAAPTLSLAETHQGQSISEFQRGGVILNELDLAEPILLAQAPTGAAPAAAPAPSPGELVSGVGTVVDDWKNLGWLAGVIALINLLLNVLRLKPLNDYLADKDWKWVKPLVAVVLGSVLGGFSTCQSGASVLNSILAGFMAGLGSVGFHELMDKLKKQTTAKPA